MPQSQQNNLLSLLSRDEITTLIKLGNAKAVELQAKAMNETGEDGDKDKFLNSANKHLKDAERYLNFVSVLEEFRKQQTHYTLTIQQD